MPFIENKIEEAVEKSRKERNDFILIEYVALPAFKIWEQADIRIMITSNREIRNIKICDRTLEKRGAMNEDEFVSLRESVFARFIKNVNNVDVVIENSYNKCFEKDLKKLCQKITSMQIKY